MAPHYFSSLTLVQKLHNLLFNQICRKKNSLQPPTKIDALFYLPHKKTLEKSKLLGVGIAAKLEDVSVPFVTSQKVLPDANFLKKWSGRKRC